MKTSSILLLAIVYWQLCPHSLHAQEKRFKQLPSSQTGLIFSNTIQETEALNVLSYEYFFNGGGTAVGDINNDGLPDLFFTANMGENKLFLNQGNRRFKDITNSASPLMKGRPNAWKTGVTMADVNGDGWLDIYVCYSGKVADDERRNQLFINQQNGTFTEQAAAYGLDDKSLSTQAAFFDFDNDGDLDLFLLNHSNKKIDNLELAKYRKDVDELAGSKLYQNNQNKFVDVSATAGIRQNPLTYGLGIVVADINQDGWQDVYVTNDYNEPDYCYLNNKNGSFTDVASDCFRYLAQFSMGADIADFNNDGLPDLVNLDMLPEDNKRQKLLQLQENYETFQLMTSQQLQKQYMRNMLQLNNGDGTFSEIGQLAGISNTDWSWCPLFADLDNDGFKDLFISNGYLRDYTNKDFLRYWGDYKVRKAIDREPAKLMDLVQAMPTTNLYNYVYRNNGDLSFSNQKESWGITDPGISSSAVYADLDLDGDLDLVINRVNKEVLVYENTSANTGDPNFLNIQVRYKDKNLFGTGTKLYVYTGNAVQYLEVNPARGYLSSLPYNQHIGLGKAGSADSVRIVWPNQMEQVLYSLKPGYHRISYGAVKPVALPAKRSTPLFQKTEKWISYQHKDPGINDFKRQLLMTFMYSSTGPILGEADLDKNGRQDLVVAGNENQAPVLYLQQPNGTFLERKLSLPESGFNRYFADLSLTDFNGDGFPDLYLAAGGYAYLEPGDSSLQDLLYMNDGNGHFTLSSKALPLVNQSSKSVVRTCDFDGDGDQDIFIGGRVVPGAYPTSPVSYLLVNNGRGEFTQAEIPFQAVGMITDAAWADLDKDGFKELILVGELMGIQVYSYSGESWKDKTAELFPGNWNGYWFSLRVTDLDGDGWDDLVLGNIGQNTQLKFSEQQPLELYYADFDGNGSIDPFLNFYIQGVSYPFVSRDELNEQMYSMRRKFSSYKDYSTAGMKELFTQEELNKAGKKTATVSQTLVLRNKKGRFERQALPVQAQFSVVTQILTDDFNRDGKMDLLLLGNRSDNRLKIGSMEANYGCLLLGTETGEYRYLPQPLSGLQLKGDCKNARLFKKGEDRYVVIGLNGQSIQFYKY
ncbi:VCBS repeat-containing protein [Flavihumibacter sp. CACIAM 22H1]|uniref:VCBS repeat-containing protein n=1 Tax=Flavihumibacter sp. CACIAM 22H1 TaxID=1812911 RepID=UPI0007A7E422|nr:VCBS repeat-containing protein [Flavihumibacter sp. CACIAM 22H1]KYP14759.1 MAG: RNA-binding protein [Flavihumibacter sp. CACIAM 22H1]